MTNERTVINLRVLVAQKEVADGRSYSYQDIADRAGVHVNLIQRMMNGQITNLPLAKTDKILNWLGVGWSDLLIRVEDDSESESPESKTPLLATA